MMLRNLASYNSSELKNFLDSFDIVLCDCDGVLWDQHNLIPGAKETISKLQQYGKRMVYVSNNNTVGIKNFYNKLHKFGFEINIDDLVNPTVAMISYLKKIQFNKDIYLLGTSFMKQDFIDAGFTVETETEVILESFKEVVNNIHKSENIGAVILDVDLNLNYRKIIKVQFYLQNPDVIFIVGATDKQIVFESQKLLGQVMYMDALEEITQRIPFHFGKPGKYINEYIMKKYNISDNSRTLVIGDSLNQDIKLGTTNGYQTLLVLTGITSMKTVTENIDREKIPDYYIDSLGSLHELI